MKPEIKKYLPVITSVGLATLLFATPAFAQSREALQRLSLHIDFSNSDNNIFNVIENIITFVLLIGGLLAFFYALLGGFTYLTAGGDQGKADNGRKIILNAIIGIIVIFLSYSLVRFVVNRVATTDQSNSITNDQFNQ